MSNFIYYQLRGAFLLVYLGLVSGLLLQFYYSYRKMFKDFKLALYLQDLLFFTIINMMFIAYVNYFHYEFRAYVIISYLTGLYISGLLVKLLIRN